MSTSILPKGFVKFSGIVLILGGLMGSIGQLFHLEDTPESVADIPHFLPLAVNFHVLLAWASTLILMGLPALFLRQASGLKWWGWLAFPLLFIGLMFEIFHGPVQILAYPILFGGIGNEADLKLVSDQINNLAVDQFPLQLLVLIPIVPCIILGLILFAAGMLKARVLPKGPAIYTFAVLVCLLAGFFVHIRFFELSFSYLHLIWVWTGAALAFGKSADPAPVQTGGPVATPVAVK